MAAIRSVFEKVRQRKGFRLTNYSVQRDYMHLVAEATDRVALSNAMRSVCSSLARAVNRTVGRRGQLVAERYHARALRVPKEVRRALLSATRIIMSEHNETTYRRGTTIRAHRYSNSTALQCIRSSRLHR